MVLHLNKEKIRKKFTEIVALRLDVFEQRLDGVWPPNTDLDRYVNRYAGTPKEILPPHVVELNCFRNEVDEFVSMLMVAIDEENRRAADER